MWCSRTLCLQSCSTMSCSLKTAWPNVLHSDHTSFEYLSVSLRSIVHVKHEQAALEGKGSQEWGYHGRRDSGLTGKIMDLQYESKASRTSLVRVTRISQEFSNHQKRAQWQGRSTAKSRSQISKAKSGSARHEGPCKCTYSIAKARTKCNNLKLNANLETKENGRAFACLPNYLRLGCSTCFGNAGLQQQYRFCPAAETLHKPSRTTRLTELSVGPQVGRKEVKPTKWEEFQWYEWWTEISLACDTMREKQILLECTVNQFQESLQIVIVDIWGMFHNS